MKINIEFYQTTKFIAVISFKEDRILYRKKLLVLSNRKAFD